MCVLSQPQSQAPFVPIPGISIKCEGGLMRWGAGVVGGPPQSHAAAAAATEVTELADTVRARTHARPPARRVRM